MITQRPSSPSQMLVPDGSSKMSMSGCHFAHPKRESGASLRLYLPRSSLKTETQHDQSGVRCCPHTSAWSTGEGRSSVVTVPVARQCHQQQCVQWFSASPVQHVGTAPGWPTAFQEVALPPLKSHCGEEKSASTPQSLPGREEEE